MRLGEILIERKFITPDDLARALDIQKERGGEKLGKIMVDLGFIAMRDLLSALAEQLHVPVLTLEGPPAVSPELETWPRDFSASSAAFPLLCTTTRSHLPWQIRWISRLAMQSSRPPA